MLHACACDERMLSSALCVGVLAVHARADDAGRIDCATLQESQTKPEGQIHFFPVIFNGKQLYDVMVERCGPSKTSGPKS